MKRYILAFAVLVLLFSNATFADHFDQLIETCEPQTPQQLEAVFKDPHKSDLERVAACAVFYQARSAFGNCSSVEIQVKHIDFLNSIIDTSQDELALAHAHEVLCLQQVYGTLHADKAHQFIKGNWSDRAKAICFYGKDHYSGYVCPGDISDIMKAIALESKDPVARVLVAQKLMKIDQGLSFKEKRELRTAMRALAEKSGNPDVQALALFFVYLHDAKRTPKEKYEIESRLLALAETIDNHQTRWLILDEFLNNQRNFDKQSDVHQQKLLTVLKKYCAGCKSQIKQFRGLELILSRYKLTQDAQLDYAQQMLANATQSGGFGLRIFWSKCLDGDRLYYFLKKVLGQELPSTLLKIAKDDQHAQQILAILCLRYNEEKIFGEQSDAFTPAVLRAAADTKHAQIKREIIELGCSDKKHSSQFEDILWKIFHEEDLDQKEIAFWKLWKNPTTQYRTQLEAYLINQLSKGSADEQFEAYVKITQDAAATEKYTHELENYVNALPAYLAGLPVDQESKLVVKMWKSYTGIKKKCFAAFENFFVKQLSAADYSVKYEACYALWYDGDAQKTHRAALETVLVGLLACGDEKLRNKAFNIVSYDQPFNTKYKPEIAAYKLHGLKSASEYARLHAYDELNKEGVFQEKYRTELDQYERDLIGQLTKGDPDAQSSAFIRIKSHALLRKKYATEFDAYCAGLLVCLTQGDVDEQTNALNIVLGNDELRKKYHDQLEEACVGMLKASSPYVQYRAAQLLWEDKTSRDKYRGPLEAYYLAYISDSVVTTKDDEFLKLWGDPVSRKNCSDVLEAKIVEELKSSNPEVQSRAYSLLTNDLKAAEKYVAELEVYLLAAFNSGDLRAQYQAFHSLWYKPKLKEKYSDKLETFLAQELASSDAQRCAVAAAKLWGDTELKEKYRDKLEAYYVGKLDSGDMPKKAEVVDKLWNDVTSRKKYEEKLEAFYVGQLVSTDATAQSIAAHKLWGESWSWPVNTLREKYRDKLEAYYVSQLESPDVSKKSAAFSVLWGDDKSKKTYQEKLTAYLVGQFESDNETKKEESAGHLWRNPNTRETHRDKLETCYVAQLASKDQYKAARAFSDLWDDLKSRVKHHDRLEAVLVAQLDSADENNKSIAFHRLWGDPKSKETHRAKLEAYLVTQLDSTDENKKSKAFRTLWNDEKLKETYRDRLEAYLITQLDSAVEIFKIEAFSNLWLDPKSQETHRTKLEAVLVMQLDSADENKKSIAFDRLWHDPKSQETYRAKLGDYLVTQLESVGKNKKLNAYDKLWNDPQLKETHREKLGCYLVILLNTGDENEKSFACYQLWNDATFREKHRDQLIAYYVAHLESDDKQKKSDAVGVLWQDLTLRNTYRDKLEAYYVVQLDSDNQNYAAIAYNALWYDDVAKVKYREKLESHLVTDLDSTDSNKKSNAVFQLWYIPNLREAHREKLESHISQQLQSTDLNTKAQATGQLWYDPKSREKYRSELEALLILELEGSDTNRKAVVIGMLWDDHKSRETHREKLGEYLFSMLTVGDAHAKGLAFERLWYEDLTLRELYRDRLEPFMLASLDKVNPEWNSVVLEALWSDHISQERHLDRLTNYIIEQLNSVNPEAQEGVLSALLGRDIKLGDVLISVLFAVVEPMVNYTTSYTGLKILISDEGLRIQQHARIKTLYERMITAFPDKLGVKFDAYLMFGEEYKAGFDRFILDVWQTLEARDKESLVETVIRILGHENPRVQELLIIFSREAGVDGARPNSVAMYADLCRKVNEPYQHRPSTMTIPMVTVDHGRDDDDGDALDDSSVQKFCFTVNPEIFDYLPVTQTQLANIYDLDALLGDIVLSDELKALRKNSSFIKYFESTTEEAIMLQAMVKKFRTYPAGMGSDAMVALMINLLQCKTGMNQAIYKHYKDESEPIKKADLKVVTSWIAQLLLTSCALSDEQIGEITGLTRADTITLMRNMLAQGHMFREHLTSLTTDHAERVKGVFAQIDTLEKALQAFKMLSKKENFFVSLDKLCHLYRVYLPANKFGDLLSEGSINGLIAKLKPSDVEGRGSLDALKAKMKAFVESAPYKDVLGDFKAEAGAKLRALMDGYVSNGWAVGLLNLAELAEAEKLDDAVAAMYEKTKINKDMDLSWRTLKKVVLQRLQGLKLKSIEAITDKLLERRGLGETFISRPHDRNHVDGYLGGVIGLRERNQPPKFDSDLNVLTPKVQVNSLQEILDMFHQEFTVEKVVEFFNAMLKNNEISVVDPNSGASVIWILLSSSVKEMLSRKGIVDTDTLDVDDLIMHPTRGATPLAMALFLTHIGVLQEVQGE